MKRVVKAFVFLLLFFSVERFCHSRTEGFSLQKIYRKCSVPQKCDPPSPATYAILSQPFTYLGSGGESYVFLSEDQTTILKFFKHHHMKEKSFLDRFSSKYPEKRKRRKEEFFTSLHLAHEHLRDETGLIYLHLGSSQGLFPQKLTLFDPLHSPHTVALDTLDFVLQKKGELALPLLAAKAKAGEDVGPYLDQILALIAKRCAAGIGDKDPVFKRNLALVGDRPIAIDFGCFYQDQSLKTPSGRHLALYFETQKLGRWISKNIPAQRELFDTKLRSFIEFSSTKESP